MAAAGTAIEFFSMAGVGASAQRNLSFIGNFLVISRIVAMLAVVANIVFANPTLHLTICAVFVLASSMIMLFQLNQIVQGGETNCVSATLTLGMSVYNLFASLLQILMALTGRRK